MKKILSVLIAIMIMISMFAGCNNESDEVDDSNSEGDEIVVEALQISFTAVVYGKEEDEEFWNKVKTAFESENAGVTVNMIVTEEAAYEVRDRILSGNSPDFVYLPSGDESGVTEALVLDKAMIALDDVVPFAPTGAFDNNICRPYEDGKAYIAPMFFEAQGLIYNKEFLSKEGFSIPDTWDDFIAVAEDCKNKNYEFFAYAGAEPDEFVDIFTSAIVTTVGNETVNKLLECEEEAWKNESIKTFIEKIEKVTKLVVSGSSTKSKNSTLSNLKDEKVLFVSGSSEDLKELNKDGDKYAICAYPSLDGNKTNIVSFTEMYIPIEAKEIETAKKFISFLYSDEVVLLIENGVKYENVFTPEFITKSSSNPTLSDEFCKLVVDVFKGTVTSENFQEKMLEYVKEY